MTISRSLVWDVIHYSFIHVFNGGLVKGLRTYGMDKQLHFIILCGYNKGIKTGSGGWGVVGIVRRIPRHNGLGI